MRRNKTMSIADILGMYLRNEGLETPLNEHRIVACWSEVVGSVISRYATAQYIRNQVLYVKVSSPAVRERLTYSREKLVGLLNEKVKATVINDIIFN